MCQLLLLLLIAWFLRMQVLQSLTVNVGSRPVQEPLLQPFPSGPSTKEAVWSDGPIKEPEWWLDCTLDRVVVGVALSDAVTHKLSPEAFHLNSNVCRPQKELWRGVSYITFRMVPGEVCGGEFGFNASHAWLSNAIGGTFLSELTGDTILLPFDCVFSLEEVMRHPLPIIPIPRLKLVAYTEPTFEAGTEYVPGSPLLGSSSLFVRLYGAEPPARLSARSCTLTNNVSDANVFLVEDGCTLEPWVGFVGENGGDSAVVLVLWLGGLAHLSVSSPLVVFLSCRVWVCSYPAICMPKCSPFLSPVDPTDSSPFEYKLSLGPIIVDMTTRPSQATAKVPFFIPDALAIAQLVTIPWSPDTLAFSSPPAVKTAPTASTAMEINRFVGSVPLQSSLDPCVSAQLFYCSKSFSEVSSVAFPICRPLELWTFPLSDMNPHWPERGHDGLVMPHDIFGLFCADASIQARELSNEIMEELTTVSATASLVTCGEEEIRVMLPLELMASWEVSTDWLRLEDASCRGRWEGEGPDEVLVWSISVHRVDCGTTALYNGSHVILSNALSVAKSTSVIERVYMSIAFSCVYPLESIVGLAYPIQPTMADELPGWRRAVLTLYAGTYYGTFRVVMELYNNSDFSLDDMYKGPPEIEAGQLLYVRISLVGAPNDGFGRLAVPTCWATHTEYPEPQLHVFFQDGCILDSTLHFLMHNGASSEVRFAVEMFRFLDPQLADVYLHCHVQVCLPQLNDADCELECESRRKRKSRAIDGALAGTVSLGPIHRFLHQMEVVHQQSVAPWAVAYFVISATITCTVLLLLVGIIFLTTKLVRWLSQPRFQSLNLWDVTRSPGERFALGNL
uniref:ZP domain-containing protein n=1 Tax=Eptatretus burgeri TaxID=7764 RepID=A0A8C4QQ72_EPTBU